MERKKNGEKKLSKYNFYNIKLLNQINKLKGLFLNKIIKINYKNIKIKKEELSYASENCQLMDGIDDMIDFL